MHKSEREGAARKSWEHASERDVYGVVDTYVVVTTEMYMSNGDQSMTRT
jgi:hypothetical protein